MTNQVDANSVILRAAKFAAEKHRDQKRKDARQTPYINHPLEVAELLSRVGNVTDLDILAAALLHDTVEDTDTKPEDLDREFGYKVRSLVMECTDDKSLPKTERKRLQVEHAPHKSPGAKQIKIADKISNIADVINSPPPDWSFERRKEYLDWSERVVNGLKGVNKALDDLYDKTLADCKAKLMHSAPGAG